MRLSSIPVWAFVLLSIFIVEIKNASAQSSGEVSKQSIEKLERMETELLRHDLVDGPARFQDITEYYWDANPELRQRLESAKDAFQQGESFRGMTLVAGPAGIGKTFIKRNVYHDDVPRERIWKFDIRELFSEFASQGLAEATPDLHHGARVFNRILSLNEKGRSVFAEMVAAKDISFILVDSLDEVHPEDYSFILKTLEAKAAEPDNSFIQVVVFGRPFAFLDYWRDRESTASPWVRGLMLNKPEFRTTGDMLVSNWNYDCWKFGLERQCGDDCESVSFADYRRWCLQDFICEGEFSELTFEANDHMTPECRRDLNEWACDHRVVGCVLPNLAANGMVRQILAEHRASKQPFDERRFMDQFLVLWLERDTLSDDRPSQIKPEHLQAYLELLETIAAKYADVVEPDGSFPVAESDMVTIDVDGESVCVPVARVLNRSGLVTVDPFDVSTLRYRFEPLWFHRLLTQMHQERDERELTEATALSLRGR